MKKGQRVVVTREEPIHGQGTKGRRGTVIEGGPWNEGRILVRLDDVMDGGAPLAAWYEADDVRISGRRRRA